MKVERDWGKMQRMNVEQFVTQLQQPQTSLAERHQAFGMLIMSYQDMACGYAFARLGNWQQAQDAAQEAFILAYQHIEQLREPEAFAAWLRRIVARCCLHLARANHRKMHRLRPLASRPRPH